MDGVGAPQLRHPGLNLHGDPRGAGEDVETSVFGFWVFLMSDAVVFALLFAIYGTMLVATAGAPGPAQEFKIGSALAETLTLLTSSFTFGMASLAMKHDWRRRGLLFWLIVTLLLGVGFLGMELHDFTTMFADGATPQRSGFLSAFFVLVGMHGFHVTAGVVWIVIMLLQLALFGLDGHVKVNILRLGLFWHFLGVIWVVIFSVVYLQGIMR
jgi:cytochrome o ubiquinol oxidase subunit 3